MQKLRFKNTQQAQGMVEFALVLPILLMITLGVIAFGHLFFVYSTTVSASREAARFGAAAGNTIKGIPRYQDCDEIIAAAVRVGRFAGVTADSVLITYDDGPDDPDINGTCAPGGVGPSVELGDRIIVQVIIPYVPIVPFLNLPSYNLEGATSRTIVRNLSVSDAPVAQDPCATETLLTPTINPVEAMAGQPVTVGATVVSVNPKPGYETPVGTVHIESDDGQSCQFNVPGSSVCDTPFTFDGVGEHYIEWRFEPQANSCYLSSDAATNTYKVENSEVVINIIADDPDPSMLNQIVDVDVEVFANGSPVTEGLVEVVDRDYPGDKCTVNMTDLANGQGTCKIAFSQPGPRWLMASYYNLDGIHLPNPAYAEHMVNEVGALESLTTITSDSPDSSILLQTVLVEVWVRAKAVGAEVPTGSVDIYDLADATTSCTAEIDGSGRGACTLTFYFPGEHTLRASYPGDMHFSPSSDDETHLVTQPTFTPTPTATATPNSTSTATPTPSQTPSPTPDYTPTKTPLPSWCPRLVNNSFQFSGQNKHFINEFYFQVQNPSDGTNPVSIDAVWVDYPNNSPVPKLSEVRFDASTSKTCSKGTICLWSNSEGLTVSPVTLGPNPYAWTNPDQSARSLASGATREMRFVFLNALNYGEHNVSIVFNNTCVLDISGTRSP